MSTRTLVPPRGYPEPILGLEGNMADFDSLDVFKVGAVMKFKGVHDVVNVWTAQLTTGGGVDYAAMYGYVADYMDILYPNITSVLSNEMDVDYLTLSNLTQDTVGGAFAWGTFAGGTHVGQPVAAQLAVLAYARTRVPRVQIRKYLGVFTEDNLTNGLWVSAVTTPCSDMMADFITAQAIGGGLEATGCAYNAVGPRVTFGQSPHISIAPVVQRRRREGRGS